MTPVLIGHRGASGYRPEHTLASYELAARMGADYLEPDLVSTSDGVLVARHEPEISHTTDVADRSEFAARHATYDIDGRSVTGWFAHDFTLAELKTLRAKERIPDLRPDNTAFDGQFEIPTFQEVIDLARDLSQELGRPLGVYPETKNPAYHRALGLPLEPGLVETLQANGLDHANAMVFVQSFEVANLVALRPQLATPFIQLIGAPSRGPVGDTRTWAEVASPDGLRQIADYAQGVGPSKDWVIPRDVAGRSLAPTSFVEDAHAAGLLVHPYTFRRENAFLPLERRSSPDRAEVGDLAGELRDFFAAGVDGVFTDNPDVGLIARG